MFQVSELLVIKVIAINWLQLLIHTTLRVVVDVLEE